MISLLYPGRAACLLAYTNQPQFLPASADWSQAFFSQISGFPRLFTHLFFDKLLTYVRVWVTAF